MLGDRVCAVAVCKGIVPRELINNYKSMPGKEFTPKISMQDNKNVISLLLFFFRAKSDPEGRRVIFVVGCLRFASCITINLYFASRSSSTASRRVPKRLWPANAAQTDFSLSVVSRCFPLGGVKHQDKNPPACLNCVCSNTRAALRFELEKQLWT